MSSNRRRVRVGEVAGGTAADCAAVCCCCPLTVMNVVVLMVYKVPTGLCRRVVRNNTKKREKRLISNQTIKKSLLRDSFNDMPDIAPISIVKSDGHDDAAENEVWNQFHGAGFWRSPSQREAS